MSADVILRNAVMLTALPLPVRGDTNSKNVLLLAHYSENPAITAFLATDQFNWTEQIPSHPEQIATFTGKYSLQFQGIYLVRLGIGPAYKTRVHNGGGGRVEHAINLALGPGDFAMRAIMYDPVTGTYHP